MMEDARTRRNWRTRNIKVPKYLHLLSSNYLQNIVKIKIKKNIHKKSGEEIAQVQEGDKADVNKAVKAAR